MMRTKYGKLVAGNDHRRPKSGKADFANRLNEKAMQIRLRRQRRPVGKPVVLPPVSVLNTNTPERVLSICGE